MSGGPSDSRFPLEDDWLARLRLATGEPTLGRVGAYRVLSTRRGGQGLVLQAVQPKTERVVALKRVGAGVFATEGDRRRFEREAELLVALEHPGIVRVFGIDVVDGEPLLVMEWVDGVGLREWARGNGGGAVPLERRLATFLEVCAAVHFSHQRGVIHRDLKPSNVLVDGDGRPRVLDFGLARRTDPGREETLTVGFVGTPAYSPPERLVDGAASADVRGDVWSLGVMLYELLTDRLPFESASIPELVEQVAHRDPTPPSQLRPGLDRDLDAIALQALAKPPEKRYPSVSHLVDDLERYLAGEPISARPRRIGYVLARWVRRRRATAALSALSLALLAGGVGYGALQAERIADERDRVALEQQRTADALARSEHLLSEAEEARVAADAARAASDRSAAEARRLSDFYLDHLFEPIIEFDDQDREGALRFVTSMADDAPEFFADFPALGPEVLSKVASAMVRMGRGAEALEVVDRALALLRESGLEGSGIAADLYSYAAIARSGRREYEEARMLVKRSIEVFEAMGRPSPRPGGYVEALSTLVELEAALGQPSNCLPMLDLAEELLAETTEDLPLYRSHAVTIPSRRVTVCIQLGKVDEAERWAQVALQRRASDPSPTMGAMINSEIALARVCMARGDFDGAVRHVIEMFDQCERFSPRLVNDFAQFGMAAAVKARRGGRTDIARVLYERMAAEPFQPAAVAAAQTALAELTDAAR